MHLQPEPGFRESYRIDGISEPECRSIFFDWAIGVPQDEDPKKYIRALLEKYAGEKAHLIDRSGQEE